MRQVFKLNRYYALFAKARPFTLAAIPRAIAPFAGSTLQSGRTANPVLRFSH